MKTDIKKLCALLYGIFALSALMQFSYLTMLVGAVALIAATGAAYAKRKEVAGTPFESHLTWLIRTFWIGTGVYLPVLTLTEAAIIYLAVDKDALMKRMTSGEITDPQQLADIFTVQYGTLMVWLTLGFTIPFLAWWLWRCWAGYKLLKDGKPVPKVMSWL